jgi:hypothetical protein
MDEGVDGDLLENYIDKLLFYAVLFLVRLRVYPESFSSKYRRRGKSIFL